MTITHVILKRLYKTVIIDTSVIKLSTSIHSHFKMYPEKRKLIPVLKQILNPLMPELNPSEQHFLPEFFIGDFKF